MTWVVPLALGGFAILLMAVFTMLSARKRHHASMAPPAPAETPRVLVHDINDDRCTGCDACVAVCPTNVLDLVANKSRVLRFHDCIQCEACMFACPTEALVMFPEGGVPPNLKVPEIDENFQTAVSGQYLIGEVAGKPLVKNAANLGRSVIEHMLQSGLVPGALGAADNHVDVAIIGSGPGGLSAALTCIQKGLSYVVLEKEQMIASTIARYPKGKLVMAEPYDTTNLSLLPVFDASKEQLIPIWREVIDRVGMQIRQGESVEAITRGGDGLFEVRSTVATYRAQRTVLSIGTRGKPRTLQVPGENLPKVFSLLEDPDEWRGRSVLVVGGGDSACEAALALADAGAKVTISYRGKGFNRAAPKNKQAIESYAGQGRIKAKLGSQVLAFEADSVTLALADGSQKRYPNDGAFVLIGADPPIAWLEKMGIHFVERPHQYQLGKTDDMVRRFVMRAIECPEDAARAAAQVLGGSIGIEPPRAPVPPPIAAPQHSASGVMPMPMGEPVSGPRKWLRSATSIFSNRAHSGVVPMPQPPAAEPAARADRPARGKKFDAPVPLSEFAKRGKTNNHTHTGHGRRDQLSAGERTRILRMLRDEGGRMADEDSQVFIGSAPGAAPAAPVADFDFDFDDGPAPPPVNMLRPEVPAKPAVVVGIAQAQAARSNGKRNSAERQAVHPRPTASATRPPPVQAAAPITASAKSPRVSRHYEAPLTLPPTGEVPVLPASEPTLAAPARQVRQPTRSRVMAAAQPSPSSVSRRPVPAPFGEEPTRQVDDELLSALRNAPPAKPSPKAGVKTGTMSKIAASGTPGASAPPITASAKSPAKPALPKPGVIPARHDEPTRISIDTTALPGPSKGSHAPLPGVSTGSFDEANDEATRSDDFPRKFLAQAPATDPNFSGPFDDHRETDESTRLSSFEGMAARHNGNDERTRAVNIRNDPSISDIDWDLD
ncbi:MAG TPA: NAD(P)-binding domain-containing protein [Kofleriaceae bacterium]|nr:NAD(P)-binding domain-containing protein [Kofleriaceae bacterium]